MQDFETFVDVLNMAIGGKDDSKVNSPSNFEDAEAQFNALFGT